MAPRPCFSLKPRRCVDCIILHFFSINTPTGEVLSVVKWHFFSFPVSSFYAPIMAPKFGPCFLLARFRYSAPMLNASSQKWVLLIGHRADPHLDALEVALEARSVRVKRIDNRRPFHISIGPDAPLSSTIQGVEGASCLGVHIRSLPPRQPPSHKAPQQLPYSREQALGETRAGQALRDPLCAILEAWSHQGITLLNPPRAGEMLENKPQQLITAAQLGLDIPKTNITSDMEGLRLWFQQNFAPAAQLVYKPVRGGDYTKPFPMPPKGRQVEHPFIFQEYIQGEHIRVLMVHGSIVCAYTLDGVEGFDFRADPNYQNGSFTYRRVELPSTLLEQLGQLQGRLDLPFCGFDIVKENTAGQTRWIFLEANGAPVYAESETHLAHGLTKTLADALTQHKARPAD